jgi:hypothetical protein
MPPITTASCRDPSEETITKATHTAQPVRLAAHRSAVGPRHPQLCRQPSTASRPSNTQHERSAAHYAANQVATVRNHPAQRLAMLHALYQTQPGLPQAQLPYRRAALAFMGWQLHRGLLNPAHAPTPGSPWWREVNERLLRDTAEARARRLGGDGPISSPPVALWETFIRQPSANNWYRAHNATIVTAYLDHQQLAENESEVERFFINLVLVRVLYAHALVVAPRLALGRLAPVAPLLGDPRLGLTGLFLSLSRVLPDRYPLRDNLEGYVEQEHRIGRLLDLGVIQPRLNALYQWSATELKIPQLRHLIRSGVPAYATDNTDRSPWNLTPNLTVRLARRGLAALSHTATLSPNPSSGRTADQQLICHPTFSEAGRSAGGTAKGHHVVIVGRSPEKTRAAATE